MRRKDEMLRDTLLESARLLTESEGIHAVNIRSLARRAGVATGTVYNYFSSKDEILLALTEEYWRQTLSEMENAVTSHSFCGQLREIFTFLRERIDKSAGKLMGSLGNVETAGFQSMMSVQSALETDLIQKMAQDSHIREDIWNETFTREQFAHFILINMMALLKSGAADMDFLIMVIQRTVII